MNLVILFFEAEFAKRQNGKRGFLKQKNIASKDGGEREERIEKKSRDREKRDKRELS